MPELGESITEGTITRWLKQEGDQVEADEPLFEVSTDKVDTEVPSPVAGVLQSIKVQADETVEVGAELAVIGGGDGGGSEAKAEPAEEKKDEKERRPRRSRSRPSGRSRPRRAPAPRPRGRRRRSRRPRRKEDGKGNGKAAAGVSPLVRRLAREHDVDLSQVQGSGSGGRVRREDVEAYVQQRGKEPAAGRAQGQGGRRRPVGPPRVAVPSPRACARRSSPRPGCAR